MKAIGVKMVDIVPMSVSMALEHGYRVGNANPNDMGYEITIQTDINLGVLKM